MKDRPLVEVLGDEKMSAYRRYLLLFVGRDSFPAFVRYELLTGLLGPLPGAAGYFLRGKCYRWLLDEMGQGSVIGRGVVVRVPSRIFLGKHVMIDDHVVLDAKGDTSRIHLGNRALLGRHSILSCNDSVIQMGDFISVGPFCIFASKSMIQIGSNVQIGAGSQLMAGGHTIDDPETPIIYQERVSQGIIVEDNVWIANNTIVLDGVTIGRNSIVGAGSVVNKDIPPFSIALGNPARLIQKRK